jgi:peptidoglycan/LPS O-acetylase OafA/YrhL
MLGGHGDAAVACFFVLSGFVITFVGTSKEPTAPQYFVARVARIYPVAIMAMLVTYIADHVGMSFSPENYIGRSYYNPDYLSNGIFNILFLNQIWWKHAIFGSNEPYWSLGFEVPYYLIFGFFLYLGGRARILLIGAYAALIGPTVLSYLPLGHGRAALPPDATR